MKVVLSEEDFYKQLFSRTSYIFSKEDIDRIRNAKIMIAGVGGVGSTTAYFLVRMGFKNFILIDFDIVETCNIGFQSYFYNDIGLYKVDALIKLLNNVNPYSTAKIYRTDIRYLEKEVLINLIKESDVIVDGMDNILAKVYLSRMTMRVGKPLVNASQCGGAARVTIFVPGGLYYEEAFNLPTQDLSDDELLHKSYGKINLEEERIIEYKRRAFMYYQNDYITEEVIYKMASGEIPFQYIPGTSHIVGLITATEIIKLITGRNHIRFPEVIHIDIWNLTLKKEIINTR